MYLASPDCCPDGGSDTVSGTATRGVTFSKGDQSLVEFRRTKIVFYLYSL